MVNLRFSVILKPLNNLQDGLFLCFELNQRACYVTLYKFVFFKHVLRHKVLLVLFLLHRFSTHLRACVLCLGLLEPGQVEVFLGEFNG